MTNPTIILWLLRKTFKVQKKRMLLTVMAIAWGTLSIVLLLSFGEGLRNQLVKSVRGLSSGVLIVFPQRTTKAYAGFPKGRRMQLFLEDVELIRGLPEVESVSGESMKYCQLAYGKTSKNTNICGVHPEYGKLRAHYPLPGGRFLDQYDDMLKRRVVFLGDKLTKDIFGDANPLGKTVTLDNMPFLVIGVLEEKTQMNMYSEPDAFHGVIPISTFKAIYGRNDVNDIIVKPRDLSASKDLESEIYRLMGRKCRFDPEDKAALSVWDTFEEERVTQNIMIGVEVFLGIIGGITLLIGGIGVANIMYATVKHRTREIGVQMALGSRRMFIMGAVVMESVILTFMGGVIGMTVGYVIIKILGFIQSMVKNEALEFLGKPTFSLLLVLLTVFILGLVGFLAGYFPSRRAASVQPAEVLRYE